MSSLVPSSVSLACRSAATPPDYLLQWPAAQSPVITPSIPTSGATLS